MNHREWIFVGQKAFFSFSFKSKIISSHNQNSWNSWVNLPLFFDTFKTPTILFKNLAWPGYCIFIYIWKKENKNNSMYNLRKRNTLTRYYLTESVPNCRVKNLSSKLNKKRILAAKTVSWKLNTNSKKCTTFRTVLPINWLINAIIHFKNADWKV